MSRTFRFWAAFGATLVVLALLVSGSSAQAKPNKPKPPKAPENVITTTGTLVVETAGGEKSYLLKNGSGATLYRLSAGPPWYYANGAYPLDKYAGRQVTVTGVVEAEKGKAFGKAKNKNKGNPAAQPPQSTVPSLEVYTINGETIRGPGKPPWAGGPKNNPNHPGNKNKNPNAPKP
ncbi:MAG TPA: hypothetical protein VF826_06185 [Chloroflexia bacterium]|jgi:hypothetical protein